MYNRKYKDRLFVYLFGREERKEWTLQLYNAVSGRDYTNADDLVINTIEDAVYMGVKNDVSFLVEGHINIYEHQSTINPNIPVRLLEYLVRIYGKYITEAKANKYSTKQIMLPVPKFVVFYNGKANAPEDSILRLSDAFPEGSDPDVSVRVKMLNINAGNNAKLMERCRPLFEYSDLIYRIRNADNKDESKDFIGEIIDELPDTYIIKPLLKANRSEVINMMLTEYNEAETMELFKQEWFEDGRVEGMANGIIQGKLMQQRESIQRMLELRMDEKDIMAVLNLSSDEIKSILEETYE